MKTSTTVTHGVAVSPDSRYAFVTSEGVGAEPGKVDIFDLAAMTRVASVDVGQQAAAQEDPRHQHGVQEHGSHDGTAVWTPGAVVQGGGQPLPRRRAPLTSAGELPRRCTATGQTNPGTASHASGAGRTSSRRTSTSISPYGRSAA